MNTQNQQNQTPEGHCTQTYYMGGYKVSNTYKCNQSFTAADVWNIQRNKREIVRKGSL